MFQVRKLYSHFSRSVSIFERVNILLNFYNRLKYNNTDARFLIPLKEQVFRQTGYYPDPLSEESIPKYVRH